MVRDAQKAGFERDLLLTWPQVDFELGAIRLITKGGVPRVLPLSREAYEILWKRPRSARHVLLRKTASRGSRASVTRSPITASARTSGNGKRPASIADPRPGHTAAMRTLRKSNLRVVQKILGHADIAITAKFYTDATVEDMRDAMEATAPKEIAATEPKQLEHKKEKGE